MFPMTMVNVNVRNVSNIFTRKTIKTIIEMIGNDSINFFHLLSIFLEKFYHCNWFFAHWLEQSFGQTFSATYFAWPPQVSQFYPDNVTVNISYLWHGGVCHWMRWTVCPTNDYYFWFNYKFLLVCVSSMHL